MELQFRVHFPLVRPAAAAARWLMTAQCSTPGPSLSALSPSYSIVGLGRRAVKSDQCWRMEGSVDSVWTFGGLGFSAFSRCNSAIFLRISAAETGVSFPFAPDHIRLCLAQAFLRRGTWVLVAIGECGFVCEFKFAAPPDLRLIVRCSVNSVETRVSCFPPPASRC